MYWIKEEAWNKHHPIQWILWSLLEWEPLSSRKGGHFSCLLFANSLLIGSLILHADVFLFLSAWKIFKNSSLHLEIKKFHLEIQISQSRNSGDLTHWATWLAGGLHSGHTQDSSLYPTAQPCCPRAVFHAHTSSSLCSFRLLLSRHQLGEASLP